MKEKVHPAVAIAAIVVIVLLAGFFVSRAFNSGVSGKIYAPGEEPAPSSMGAKDGGDGPKGSVGELDGVGAKGGAGGK